MKRGSVFSDIKAYVYDALCIAGLVCIPSGSTVEASEREGCVLERRLAFTEHVFEFSAASKVLE